jgi:hypothetical protein
MNDDAKLQFYKEIARKIKRARPGNGYDSFYVLNTSFRGDGAPHLMRAYDEYRRNFSVWNFIPGFPIQRIAGGYMHPSDQKLTNYLVKFSLSPAPPSPEQTRSDAPPLAGKDPRFQ